jgi:hypothetical protein
MLGTTDHTDGTDQTLGDETAVRFWERKTGRHNVWRRAATPRRRVFLTTKRTKYTKEY